MSDHEAAGVSTDVAVRQARPADVRAIYELVQPYAERGILIDKELITYFEAVQEFVVAEVVDETGTRTVGCGALHVLWDDIAEVRTLAVDESVTGRGVGRRLLETLVGRARGLGLKRVFCLTFEVEFFRRHGFEVIAGTPVGTDVYAQMLRSHDDGVAEFLDLARVKPNTLGNSRMLLEL
ncbi:amino-acid N-acetyltransferase [Georgenia subflava]|uniref:amino-acid N-acetyltransferase n=1 Tax=Georgenia subflava TaxID=1622177 RepID=UPI00186B2C69|nr:amino-acid N-acetyltransferase [Georgenia subflava]